MSTLACAGAAAAAAAGRRQRPPARASSAASRPATREWARCGRRCIASEDRDRTTAAGRLAAAVVAGGAQLTSGITQRYFLAAVESAELIAARCGNRQHRICVGSRNIRDVSRPLIPSRQRDPRLLREGRQRQGTGQLAALGRAGQRRRRRGDRRFAAVVLPAGAGEEAGRRLAAGAVAVDLDRVDRVDGVERGLGVAGAVGVVGVDGARHLAQGRGVDLDAGDRPRRQRAARSAPPASAGCPAASPAPAGCPGSDFTLIVLPSIFVAAA